MAAPLVLALGGSLLRPDESERHAWLSALAEVVGQCEVPVGIVVGGGVSAREAIALAKSKGENDVAALDEIGIAATRINAELSPRSFGFQGSTYWPGFQPMWHRLLKDFRHTVW